MVRSVLLFSMVTTLCACSKDETAKGGQDGWTAPAPVASTPGNAVATDDQGQLANPHGDTMPTNPHGGAMSANPHDDGEVELPPGMSAPDPNRPVDPNKYLKGTIVATKKTEASIADGAIIYLSVRPVDPKTGTITGGLLAVERIDVTGKLPVEFKLTEANAMVAGTQFVGDVQLYGRVDQDGEARSKEKGDVEGAILTRIPADNLTLTLDSIVE